MTLPTRTQLLTRAQLRERGVTDRQIARLISSGRLVRLRGGLYATPQADPALQAAGRSGGVLACASELRRLGAWVLDDGLHVHYSDVPRTGTTIRHWGALRHEPVLGSVAPIDAVLQTLSCLDLEPAVAAVDSALHLGLVRLDQLAEPTVRGTARRRIRLLDARAESGLESMARLIARDLGFRVRPQVTFSGIGRVDLLLEGRVVVEADGDRFHGDPVSRRRDRRRDAQLMARGYPVLRFGYEQLVGRPAEVARAMIQAVASHRSVKHSTRIVGRASARAARRGWT